MLGLTGWRVQRLVHDLFFQPLQSSLLVLKRRMLGLHPEGQRNRSKCVASCALKLVQVENGFKKFGFSKRP
jgi:hypothetical protein